MTLELKEVAVYVRRSTAKQDDEHQRDDIVDWLARRGLTLGDVDLFAEQASGTDGERDQFRSLVESIEDEEYENVVVWEVSRIARKGLLAQRFFDAAEDAGATIHVTHGSVREIRPDGTGRLVADIIASVAAEERRTLIRRTRSGQRRARSEGKWLGQVPAGFIRDDGYLKPNLDPDYEGGEVGFFDIEDALDALEEGESYNSVADRTPNVTRQTLSTIHQDDNRRSWYFETEADDGRVAAALSEL